MFVTLGVTRSQLLEGFKCESQTQNNGRVRNRSTFPRSQHFGGVERHARAPRWDQEELISFTYSHEPAQNQHKVVSASLEHLWCQDESRATQTHKTHHGPDLGESTTFPFIWLPTRPTSKWPFVPRLPSGSPEITNVETSAILVRHNFACRPVIEMRSEAKL